MRNCLPFEQSIEDSAARLFKGMKNKTAPLRRVGAPIGAGVATVGLASGAYLWHVNQENTRKYGAR
jgi:hypothetical protein